MASIGEFGLSDRSVAETRPPCDAVCLSVCLSCLRLERLMEWSGVEWSVCRNVELSVCYTPCCHMQTRSLDAVRGRPCRQALEDNNVDGELFPALHSEGFSQCESA